MSEVMIMIATTFPVLRMLNEGKFLGLVEGEARGSRKKALETARLMRQRNYPPVEICLMTGLSQEEVEGLS